MPDRSPRLRRYLHLEMLAEATGGDRTPGLARDLESAWRRLSAAEVRWLRARAPVEDPFGNAGRARKVLALLEVVPLDVDPRTLARAGAPFRAAVARAAGCRPPSDTTWRMVVDAVEARAGGLDAVTLPLSRG